MRVFDKRQRGYEPAVASLDSFKARQTLDAGGKTYTYYSIPEAEKNGLASATALPFCDEGDPGEPAALRGRPFGQEGRHRGHVGWLEQKGKAEVEIAFRPARVLMQDFTGVPAVVDLAAMRDAMVALGGDPQKINPLVPVDLVIDHSVIVDEFGTPKALADNVALEYERNGERYTFLKWGQSAFDNFSVVPPGYRHLPPGQSRIPVADRVDPQVRADGSELAYPDTLVGTDSHTTMVNGMAVLGWGVGGIEAEAAMLGQPLSMLIPEVVGFKLSGKLPEGTHRDRPRADRHADAAQEGRGRQVRGVLRPRPRRHGGGRPRHHLQHGARNTAPPAGSSRSTGRPSTS